MSTKDGRKTLAERIEAKAQKPLSHRDLISSLVRGDDERHDAERNQHHKEDFSRLLNAAGKKLKQAG